MVEVCIGYSQYSFNSYSNQQFPSDVDQLGQRTCPRVPQGAPWCLWYLPSLSHESIKIGAFRLSNFKGRPLVPVHFNSRCSFVPVWRVFTNHFTRTVTVSAMAFLTLAVLASVTWLMELFLHRGLDNKSTWVCCDCQHLMDTRSVLSAEHYWMIRSFIDGVTSVWDSWDTAVKFANERAYLWHLFPLDFDISWEGT
jgi:hypothetical protein